MKFPLGTVHSRPQALEIPFMQRGKRQFVQMQRMIFGNSGDGSIRNIEIAFLVIKIAQQ